MEDFESDFERIDGLLRSISIGTDNNSRIHFAVTDRAMPDSGLTIKEIFLDRAKLSRFGVTHFVITVKDGDHSRIWREVVNNVQIEHDVSDLVLKVKNGSREGKYTVL